MDNSKIIADMAVTIWGREAVEDMLLKGQDIPLHTLKNWSDRGYRVRKGEHGIEAKLWKKRRKVLSDECGAVKSSNKDFYLAKAYLFREDQVIKVDESEVEDEK